MIPRLSSQVIHGFDRLHLPTVATNSAYLFANSIVTALLGVIFWAIAARFYDLDAVGRTAAVVSSATLIAMVSNLGFSALVIRFLPISGTSEVRLSAIASLTPAVLATSIAFVFYSLPMNRELIGSSLQIPFAIFIPVGLTAALAVSAVQDSIFIARQESIYVLIVHMGGTLVRLIVLSMFAHAGAIGLVGAFSLGGLVTLALGVHAWKKKLPWTGETQPSIHEMAKYGATNYVTGLLNQAPQLIFPFLIATQISATAAGAFNYAWLGMAVIMALPPLAANALLANLVSPKGNIQQHLRITMFAIVAFIALLAALSYIAALIIIPIVLSKGSQDVLQLLPLLLGSVVFYAIVRLQSMLFAWRMHLQKLLILNFVVAVAAMTLPVILLGKNGVLGLEIGWLVSQIIGVSAGYVLHNLAIRRPDYA
jgi:O-antigen/teichoic acid export membrane protein